MPSIKVYNMKGQETGSMELSDIFAIEYNGIFINTAKLYRLCKKSKNSGQKQHYQYSFHFSPLLC